MDKYRRVEKQKQNDEQINENEIRVTTQGKIRNFISYATALFGPEKKQSTIVFEGNGKSHKQNCHHC